MTTTKEQKLTDGQLMECIDLINEVSGVELDKLTDLVLKNGKKEKEVLQAVD